MNTQLERHQLADKAREFKEEQAIRAWENFKDISIDRVMFEIKNDGDIITLLTEISVGYDDLNFLTDKEVNEILGEAYRRVLGAKNEIN